MRARNAYVVAVWVVAGIADPARAAEPEKISWEEYRTTVTESRQAYQGGEFEKAHGLCSKAARWGEKDCQYMLAMMYLSGKGAGADIVEGYAWYTVAMESRNPIWVPVYRQLTKRLPAPVLDAARQRGEQYVAQFGMDATGVWCWREQKAGALDGRMETVCGCPDIVDRSDFDLDPCDLKFR